MTTECWLLSTALVKLTYSKIQHRLRHRRVGAALRKIGSTAAIATKLTQRIAQKIAHMQWTIGRTGKDQCQFLVPHASQQRRDPRILLQLLC